MSIHIASPAITKGFEMRLIFRNAKIEIWAVNEAWGVDYYVYGVYSSGDPRICPSLGMAYEVAAR